MRRLSSHKGFTIVEILVGLALFAVILIFIYETLTLFFQNQTQALQKTQALYLAESGQEYVRYLRDEDWTAFDALSTATPHYFSISTTSITTTNTPEVIEGTYTRSFVLWPAYRNADDDLVASTTPGASIDAGSYVVVSKVTWDPDQEVRLESLLTNLQNN